MIGYFCINPHNRGFLYVPFNFLVYSRNQTNKLVVRAEAELLNKLAIDIANGKLSKQRLEDSLWDVFEVHIPDEKIKSFRDLCFKNRSKREIQRIGKRIFRWVEYYFDEFYDNEDLDNMSGAQANNEEDPYSEYEDYLGDWWRGGDSPPCFDIGSDE